MRAYVLIIAVTAFSCLVLTPLIRQASLRGRAYTPHRARDMHVRAVPKLGGVAMVMAVLVGMTVAGTVPFLDGIFTDSAPVRGLLTALGIIAVLGIVDDLWDLRWWAKMAGQVAAALAVAWGGIRVEAMPFGWIPVGDEPTQILLTVFVIVLTMNAINFVDGLDGLAAGVALIGGSAFFLYSYLLTRTIDEFDYSNLATLMMALLVGATAGFLPYNLNPAKIFMGEVGALLLGLLLASAAVAVTADVGALDGFRFRNVPAYMPILLPLAVLALPLLDLTLAVIRRTARGSSPFSADRGHLHHKLVDGGYTQPQAVALLWLWSFLVSWGTVSLNFLDDRVVLPVMAVLLTAAGYLTLHPLVRRRRSAVPRRPDHSEGESMTARRRRASRENTRGWWGILTVSVLATAVVVALCALVCGLLYGPEAAASAGVGGTAVLLLSAATLALIAWLWSRQREMVMVLSIGAFVLKIVLYGLLLTVVPRPDWLEPLAAGAAALVAMAVWQAAEVLVFSRTRRSIY